MHSSSLRRVRSLLGRICAYLLQGAVSAREICRQFERRLVGKTYLAVVIGQPTLGGLLQTPLAEIDGYPYIPQPGIPLDEMKVASAAFTVVANSVSMVPHLIRLPESQSAVLQSTFPGLTLLKVKMFTGMKHQLRIQAAQVLQSAFFYIHS